MRENSVIRNIVGVAPGQIFVRSLWEMTYAQEDRDSTAESDYGEIALRTFSGRCQL